MSKIVKAEIFKHRYTLEGYKLSYGTIKEVFPVILKLTDNNGNNGWGEANAQRPFTDEDSEDVIEVLRNELLPLVLEEDVADPAHIDRLLDPVRPQADLLAKGAINIALLDLKGKSLGVSVAELLGGPIRQSIPVSHPLNNGDAQDDIHVIDERMREGYVDFMLKMGTSPIAREIERVATLEMRYGDRIKFKADANTGWTRDQSLEFLAGVANSSLVFVEQPVAKIDINGMAMLAQRSKIPISADESLTGIEKALEIIRKKAANVFSIKITKNGGILRSKALAGLAQQHGISCYANSMLEGGITQAASLQLAVTIPNLLPIGHSFRSVLRLVEGEVTDFASNIRNAVVHLPRRPGLGTFVDEARLRSSALGIYSLE
ncbi:hypothetical protein M409DRAFT_23876 [Zasmidium cellare ATCC 36951]|uniref:Mandelate racemase/muconate lactonizing enzyme C-terminal domain-containing protein n=1 Tax=Zasmidium cellare ATCC 36951 TaxID=1080233 RepID=A0A6A6CI02_ZASCE|nr:uncharacterized protein M409DRAFT_23876 [Zasmidium cellare ATCC 36951]KAF2165582.1 hypothetical protein M409DRAFT_23876 [Zasmidium cellare ATCC 36951]